MQRLDLFAKIDVNRDAKRSASGDFQLSENALVMSFTLAATRSVACSRLSAVGGSLICVALAERASLCGAVNKTKIDIVYQRILHEAARFNLTPRPLP